MKNMDYATACDQASKEQGISAIVDALGALGIKASSAQTGGFTMCAYVELTAHRFIYANPFGVSIYSDEDYLSDISQHNERQDPALIAQEINNYINA